MNTLEIVIDDKKYEYIDNTFYQDKNYVAFSDNNNIYIKEYKIINDDIMFYDIDDALFQKVKELMNL